MSLNKVTLLGNIAQSRHQLTNDTHLSMFTVAVQRPFKNKNGEYDTDFIQVKAFGRTEGQADYYKGIKVGTRVTVEGRLTSSSYEKDGKTQYSQDIIVERLSILNRPKAKDENYDQEAIESLMELSDEELDQMAIVQG